MAISPKLPSRSYLKNLLAESSECPPSQHEQDCPAMKGHILAEIDKLQI